MNYYQVIEHGFTTGRDSGYPATFHTGPQFGTTRGAQGEADRLLSMLDWKPKTIMVTQINPETGSYDFTNQVEKPVYEVVKVPILTQAQADARIQGFVNKAIDAAEKKAASLEAEAATIRAAWKADYGV